MARRMTWIPMALVIAVAALAQPWRGRSAEARPAACTAGEVARLKAELAATRAELAEARAVAERAKDLTSQLLEAVAARQKRLAAERASPVVETLKGTRDLD